MGVNKESLFFSVYIFQHAFIRDFSHIYIHNVWLLLFFSGLGKDRNVAYVRNIHCICLGTHVCLSFFISFFSFWLGSVLSRGCAVLTLGHHKSQMCFQT